MDAALIGCHAGPARVAFVVGVHIDVTTVLHAVQGASRVVAVSDSTIKRRVMQCANEVLVRLSGWLQQFRILSAVALIDYQVDNVLNPPIFLPYGTE